MILYNLKCSQSHNFEAWFKDGQAFDVDINCRNTLIDHRTKIPLARCRRL